MPRRSQRHVVVDNSSAASASASGSSTTSGNTLNPAAHVCELPLVVWQHIASFRPSAARIIAQLVPHLELRRIAIEYLQCCWRSIPSPCGNYCRLPCWLKECGGRAVTHDLPWERVAPHRRSVHFDPPDGAASGDYDAVVACSEPLPAGRASWSLRVDLRGEAASHTEAFSIGVYPSSYMMPWSTNAATITSYFCYTPRDAQEKMIRDDMFFEQLDTLWSDDRALVSLSEQWKEEMNEELPRTLYIQAQVDTESTGYMCWGDKSGWKFALQDELPVGETPREEVYNRSPQWFRRKKVGVAGQADPYQLVLRGNCSGISATFVQLPHPLNEICERGEEQEEEAEVSS